MWETKPRHAFDFVLWPLIAFFWEPFSKKHAHWWHWRNYSGQVIKELLAPGDSNAGNRTSGFWANLYYTNFGWTSVLVLEPVGYSGKYQIGFRSDEGKSVRTQLCSLILGGQTAVQLGPVETEFFAVNEQGEPIELRSVTLTTKKKLRGITLI